jgi:pSer/pThr/pTyr-binding forkhead associated (FHA) protein
MTWLEFSDTLEELPDGDVVIGGGPQATLRIQHLDLRPRHFTIQNENGRPTLCPFSNDSVVALNGKQISSEPSPLRDGDMIEAGSATFWFREAPKKLGTQNEKVVSGHLIDVSHGKAYSLARMSTLIGRDPNNAVVLLDPTVSRFHAEVRREAGGFALHAMGSTGTALNGRMVASPALLEEGDEVSIAGTILRFTQGPLPAGLSTVISDEVPDDLELAHRRTIRVKGITSSQETGAVRPASTSGSFLVVVGVLIALVVLAMFFLFRHGSV